MNVVTSGNATTSGRDADGDARFGRSFGVPGFVVGAILLSCFFVLVPEADLWVSGWFGSAEDGFPLRRREPWRTIYAIGNEIEFDLLVAAVVALFLTAFARRGVFDRYRPQILFVILSFALVPGILVNEGIKRFSGRPRPRNIVDFGGEFEFVRLFDFTGPCTHNCSFVSGHAALGFAFIAFALVLNGRYRRIGVMLALAAGAVFSVGRVVQGGHFLSDVVFAGIVTCGTIWLMHRWLIGRGGFGRIWESAVMRAVRRRAVALPLLTSLAGAIAWSIHGVEDALASRLRRRFFR